MVTMQDRVRLIRDQSQRLVEYLVALSPEALSQSSACADWTVADVVGHLTWAGEGFADAISRGIQGDLSPRPPEGFPTEGSGVSRTEYIAQSGIAHRKKLGDGLILAFNASSDRLNQVLASLRPEDFQKSCNFMTNERPVEALVTTRVQELAIHDWDIRANLDPAPHLYPESLPVLLERVPTFVAWAFRPAASLAAPLRYRFQLTGTIAGGRDVVVEGDRVRVEPAPEASAEASAEAPIEGTLRAEAETFVLLMCGRLSADGAMAEGRLAAESDGKLVADFGRWFGEG